MSVPLRLWVESESQMMPDRVLGCIVESLRWGCILEEETDHQTFPHFFKIGISGTGLTMAPIRLWVSSNAGSNQGKEQLNRQVRRPLVQMAAVKLGSQPFGRSFAAGEVASRSKLCWLLHNSTDEATNKKTNLRAKGCAKMKGHAMFDIKTCFIQEATTTAGILSPQLLSWSRVEVESPAEVMIHEAGGANHNPGISMLTTWNLLNDGNMKSSNLQIFRFFSRKSSRRFSLANRWDERVRKGSKMSQLTVICVNLEAKAQIVNCLHGIAYRDQYHRNASFLRLDIATRQTWQCSAKSRKKPLNEVLRSSLIIGDMPKFELEVVHGQECL